VFQTATVTNMLRLKIHISSCQTTLSYFETRCDTAMISDSLVGRLNISAEQIIKVGSHEICSDQVYFCACHDTPQKWGVHSLPYLYVVSIRKRRNVRSSLPGSSISSA